MLGRQLASSPCLAVTRKLTGPYVNLVSCSSSRSLSILVAEGGSGAFFKVASQRTLKYLCKAGQALGCLLTSSEALTALWKTSPASKKMGPTAGLAWLLAVIQLYELLPASLAQTFSLPTEWRTGIA